MHLIHKTAVLLLKRNLKNNFQSFNYFHSDNSFWKKNFLIASASVSKRFHEKNTKYVVSKLIILALLEYSTRQWKFTHNLVLFS